MSAAPDAIVIGGGIVGAAITWHLARDGVRTLLLDAAQPGGGATAGGMGHVVVMDDSPAQLALSAWSRSLLRDIAGALPPSCELDDCGTLWVAEDDAQLAAARARHALFDSAGIGAELLDEAALREAEPTLRRGLAGALRVPGDMVVYPPALCEWLLREALARVAVLRSHVRVARIDGGTEPVVHCADGTRLAAAAVINAAGAHAPALTPGLDIVPRRGHLVITDRYTRSVRHQLVELGYLQSAHTMTDVSVAFNVQPRRTGQLLVGSSRELVGWRTDVNRDVVGRMLRRALDFLPALAGMNAVRTWTALRPASPDHLPYIGASPHQQNVWVAAGHEGLGITTALATGRIIADMLAGRAGAIDVTPFAPARSTMQQAHA